MNISRHSNEVMILGGGLQRDRDRLILSPASNERVDRFLRYYTDNRSIFQSSEAQIICSGGYPRLAEGAALPLDGTRESTLMADALIAQGIDAADVEIEDTSYSTITNFTHSIAKGLLNPERYSQEHTLGVVTHSSHLNRIGDFSWRLGLPKDHIEGITVVDSPSVPTRILREAYKIAMLGAHGPYGLENRELSLYRVVEAVHPPRQL